VLALTGQPRRAADALLAAVPKSAKLGREGFATMLAWQLARRGVVPLNPGAFRRLDRVDTVVVDSSVLCTTRPQVLEVDPASGVEDLAPLWQHAGRLLQGQSYDDVAAGITLAADGWRLRRVGGTASNGAVHLSLLSGRRRVARVTVGRELMPYADALVDSARSTGARVLLTADARADDLRSRVDDVLDAGQDLAHHVRGLQRQGRCVLVLAGSDDDALAAADVGIGVVEPGAPVSWSADLLCGPDVRHAWYLLEATGRARAVSEQSVRLAKASSALGELLALVGGPATHATATRMPRTPSYLPPLRTESKCEPSSSVRAPAPPDAS